MACTRHVSSQESRLYIRMSPCACAEWHCVSRVSDRVLTEPSSNIRGACRGRHRSRRRSMRPRRWPGRRRERGFSVLSDPIARSLGEGSTTRVAKTARFFSRASSGRLRNQHVAQGRRSRNGAAGTGPRGVSQSVAWPTGLKGWFDRVFVNVEVSTQRDALRPRLLSRQEGGAPLRQQYSGPAPAAGRWQILVNPLFASATWASKSCRPLSLAARISYSAGQYGV